MDPVVQVQVVDEFGNTIGGGSFEYVDGYAAGVPRTIVTRAVQLQVVDEFGNVIGGGIISYDDYVSYMFGGTRTVTVSGYVYSETQDRIGAFTIGLTDTYGIEQAVLLMLQAVQIAMLIVLIGVVLMAVVSLRKAGESI